jgi:hypothetical protein
MFKYSLINTLSIVLFCAILFITKLKAQDQWMMHMPTLQQSYINPAHQLKNKLEIGLPSFSFDLNSGGINLKDAIAKNSEGVNVIDLDKVVGSLEDLHPFNASVVVNTIDVGFKIKSLSVFAGHNVQNQTSFVLDRDLADLLVNGNAAYIGKTVDLDIQGASSTFNQFYVGASKQIGKLGVGVKLKYISGWYDIRSENSKIALTTEEDYYQIKLQNDIRLQSSGVVNYSLNVEDITFNTDFFNSDLITSNSGYGIDLGVTYAVNKELTLMASAIDLGSISWSNRAKTLTNNKTTRVIGINLETIIDGGETENVQDSLYGAFDLVQTNASYSTALNAQFNGGLTYIKDGLTFSALYNNQNLVGQNKYTMSFQVSKQLGKIFNLGLSYSIKNHNFNNIGLLANVSLGSVNIFAVTQSIFSAFDSRKISGVNGRIGLSLAFGRSKDAVKEEE